jgi:hypothetical protein
MQFLSRGKEVTSHDNYSVYRHCEYKHSIVAEKHKTKLVANAILLARIRQGEKLLEYTTRRIELSVSSVANYHN